MFSTTTTRPNRNITQPPEDDEDQKFDIKNNEEDDLGQRYEGLFTPNQLNWSVHYHLLGKLGEGGQGVVYLTEQRGADGFTVPVAIKIFDPTRHADARSYDEAMGRIASVSAHVAQINQDNLLDVKQFVDRDR